PTAERQAATLSPQRRRRQTIESILEMLLHLAAQRPVLMIIEDLHWVDPSTIELLGLVMDQARTARLLLILTARPDFLMPWSTAHLTRLTLNRLRRAQVEQISIAVSGGKALPPEVLDHVAQKTDGVPLFVEEL